MKKVFLLAAFGVAGLVSAKNTIGISKVLKLEKVASCSWCIPSGGSMYCATASTCKAAKAIAIAMAQAAN